MQLNGNKYLRECWRYWFVLDAENKGATEYYLKFGFMHDPTIL